MAIRLTDAAAVSAAVLLFFWFSRGRSSAPLPPGPKKLPLLENLLDMPTEREWLKFAEWGNKYGNLVSVSIFGQLYIIVSSAQTAIEMLDKKSRIYSDRPVMQMGGELVGWKDALILIPYSQRFRDYRKMFHQVIGTSDAMNKFHPVEERAVRRFLKNIYSSPEELPKHIRKAAGTIILDIAYGYEVEEGTDPFVSMADEAVAQFSLSTSPGAFLVNLAPSLRHLPDWFPGSGFKQTARAWRNCLYETVEKPYQFVKKRMEIGAAEPSMMSNLLQDESDLSDERIVNIKWATASAYTGGADTTVATIHAFFKAILLYPEVQKKAQAEIDAVIGSDRLPTMEDREKLPFVNAIALEALRWHSVTPTGFPHRVTEDNFHDGYLIPKGALVIPNIWKMAHDPDVYQRPMEFNPARFIKTKDHTPETDPRELIFGFGRRICPGRLLADTSVFLSCAMTLAVFNVMPYMENGKAVMPSLDQCTGIISHPSKFKCQITPRSPKAIALINADWS